MSKQKFPPGWDEARVREVLAHYESQSEDEQFAEIEAAQTADGVTLMAVPTELVPEVRTACTFTKQVTLQVDHILAGSDYPHQIGSIPKMLASLKSLKLPPADEAKILGGNARGLLGI